MITEPAWTLGIEEEYFIVHAESGLLVEEPAPEFLKEAAAALGEDRVNSEYLKSQIEVNTSVCSSISDARQQIQELRSTLGELAAKRDLAIMASSTHPSSSWAGLERTDDPRYGVIQEQLQVVVDRALVCGMHVHVGIEDQELRIDMLNQITYFLPYLLALSTSSPFWSGRNTGLLSYRTSILSNLPRTDYPDHFSSYAEYERYVNVLVECGAIPDSSMLWWPVRPSSHYPTLEMRVCDICTDYNDTIALAATYLCLLRGLYRLRRDNMAWRKYSSGLLMENQWRAQRYGISEGLIDYGASRVLPFDAAIQQLQDMLADDAEYLGCTDELAHLSTIFNRGTSAQSQLATYTQQQQGGAEPEEALRAVCLDIIRNTIAC